MLQPTAQLESSIRCECFKISCVATWHRTRSAQVSGRLAGRNTMEFSALSSPLFTPHAEPLLSRADPNIPFQRPADDRFPLAARCSGWDGFQRCEGCLAATDIANSGQSAVGFDYIARLYRSQNADTMCWMRCIDRL